MTLSSTRNAIAAATCLAALFSSAGEAPAQLIGSCTITVQNAGTLTVNSSLNILGSGQAGGAAAIATVKPSSLGCSGLPILDPLVCFSMSAPPPATFLSAPGGGGDNVGFASTYTVNGGPPIGGAATTLLANGTHTVAIGLTATRGSGVFPAGGYQAQVTLRCE